MEENEVVVEQEVNDNGATGETTNENQPQNPTLIMHGEAVDILDKLQEPYVNMYFCGVKDGFHIVADVLKEAYENRKEEEEIKAEDLVNFVINFANYHNIEPVDIKIAHNPEMFYRSFSNRTMNNEENDNDEETSDVDSVELPSDFSIEKVEEDE